MNNEAERTEELTERTEETDERADRPEHGPEELVERVEQNRRRKYVIAIAIVLAIALACAGIFGYTRMRAARQVKAAKQQVALGDQAIREDDFKNGISHYSKAIRTEKKNAELFVKRGDAYVGLADQRKTPKDEGLMGKAEKDYSRAAALAAHDETSRKGLAEVYARTGDREKLRGVYVEMEKITGDSSYGELADCAMLGNSSSNLANDGFFLEGQETCYIAGALNAAAISKVGEDGELEIIWKEKEDEDDENGESDELEGVVLSDLNLWDGYIYYLRNLPSYGYGDTTSAICRVKQDGSDHSELVSGESLDNLKIIDGRLFYTEEESETPALYTASLDGSGATKLYDRVSDYAGDGTDLYIKRTDDESAGFAIQKAESGGGSEPVTIMEPGKDQNTDDDQEAYDDQSDTQMITYRGALYFTVHTEEYPNQTMKFYRYRDGEDSSPVCIHEKTLEESAGDRPAVTRAAIKDGEITYFSLDEADSWNWDGEWKINTVALKEDADSLEESSDSCHDENVDPAYIACSGDRIYMRNRQSYDGEDYCHVSVNRRGGDVRVYNHE